MRKEKVELIGRLMSVRQEPTCRVFMALLDLLIEETRVNNDTAEGGTLWRNQGKIEGYKELIEIITKGLPVSFR